MKKVFILFLSFSVILILSACSADKSEQVESGGKSEQVKFEEKSEQVKTTENFLNALVKNNDKEDAIKYLSNEMKEFSDFNVESIEAFVETSESLEFKKFEESLKKTSEKTKYTVQETGEQNQIKVVIEYADISKPIQEGFDEFLTKSFYETASGITVSDEESAEILYEFINSKLENYIPEIKEVESIVELKDENGNIVISKLDDSLIQALSYGFNINLE